MKRTRKSFSYKINMWLYRLTFHDIIKIIKTIILTLLEMLMVMLTLLLIFIIPALFH